MNCFKEIKKVYPRQEKVGHDRPAYQGASAEVKNETGIQETLNPYTTFRFTFAAAATTGIIHRLVAEAMDEYKLREKDIIAAASVGCSVFLYDYFDVDVVESPHGRAAAVASGVKRAKPDNFVFTYQGDGDLAAIGTAEIIHAANRGDKGDGHFCQQYRLRHDRRADGPHDHGRSGQHHIAIQGAIRPKSTDYPIKMAELLARPRRHGLFRPGGRQQRSRT